MSDTGSPLSQGWTLSKQAIADTQDFWAMRNCVEMSEDEAREALYNMASFIEILTSWETHPSASVIRDDHKMYSACTPTRTQLAPVVERL